MKNQLFEFSQLTISKSDVEKAQGADFETAIHYSKYGKFQALLLTVCGTIYATCAISTTTLSFVLPSAECDFELSSMDKGKLSAMPLIGMIFGCSIWGSLADSRGRKFVLISCLLLDFSAAFVSSFSQSFTLFLVCRFFNGFGIIGATSIIFPYFGEFLSHKHRDVMLGRLEIFWNVGIIFLPGLAWLLLKHIPDTSWIDIEHPFSPWRAFVLVCGVPSLISAIMLAFLPETPKYLISLGKYEEARNVFQKVFTFNTGLSPDDYPVLTLSGELETNNNICDDKKSINWKSIVVDKIRRVIKDIRKLCSQPYLRYLLITSFADFGLMASYYTLIMWFPEIFERFNQYEINFPDTIASVCTVSEAINKESIFIDNPCNSSINTRVFIDTIIIGLSCLPTSVSLSYFMKKLGKNYVLVFSLIISGISTLSLNWVQSSTETLILACVFEALTSLLETVLFCVVVDLFPTHLRALALSVTATSGRIGAIFGNVIFGMLIDLNCVIPVYLFGFLLILSGILCMAIPKSENYIVLHE